MTHPPAFPNTTELIMSNAPTSPMSGSPPVLKPLEEVSRRAGDDALADRLLELRTWLVDDLMVLENDLAGCPGAAQGLNPTGELARCAEAHLVAQPGKRIRPLCVMLAARMGGRAFDEAVKDLAVSCELIHAATLLHDDVLDEGEERRGTPTSRVLYGNSASILAGDHLLLYALRRVDHTGDATLLTSAMKTISEMVAAETLQLERRRRFEPSREDYMSVVKGKTAALFRWGLKAGGKIAGMSSEHVNALGEVGLALGTAFQLIDDVLDLEGDPEVTGKALFADLREGKLTWPVILGCERNPALLEMMRAHILDESVSAGTIVHVLREVNAVADTRAFAEAQGATARELLSRLGDTEARRAMELIIDTIVFRRA